MAGDEPVEHGRKGRTGFGLAFEDALRNEDDRATGRAAGFCPVLDPPERPVGTAVELVNVVAAPPRAA